MIPMNGQETGNEMGTGIMQQRIGLRVTAYNALRAPFVLDVLAALSVYKPLHDSYWEFHG